MDPLVYSDAGISLFNTYSMLLGEFDVETYVGGGLGSSAALFFYTTFVTNIVLLNALIAIMSDTYDRVTETLRERGLIQRAKLLLEQQSLMSAETLRNTVYFPEWLHAIQRVDEGEAEGEHAWAGRIMHPDRTVEQSTSSRRARAGTKATACRLEACFSPAPRCLLRSHAPHRP